MVIGFFRGGVILMLLQTVVLIQVFSDGVKLVFSLEEVVFLVEIRRDCDGYKYPTWQH